MAERESNRTVAADKVAPSEPKLAGASHLIDLGRQKASQVRKLRQGKGKLVDEISAALAGLKQQGELPSGAHPVIVLVRERRGGGWPWD
jgi:hypothetical protein